jgi:hypothetical protein
MNINLSDEAITIIHNALKHDYYTKRKAAEQVDMGLDPEYTDKVTELIETFEAMRPTRPATDYEKAMSGKDRMPADTTPWHE